MKKYLYVALILLILHINFFYGVLIIIKMISFVTILGFVLSALIFINRNERYGPNLFLALFICFNSFYALISNGIISNEYRWLMAKVYPFVILPNMSAGPFMFLYFAYVFKPNFQFKPIHFWHFLPALLFFINGSDYLFWDSTQKAKLYQAFMIDSSTMFSMPTFLIPYYWHILFRVTQTFVYLLVCFILFYGSLKSNGFKLWTDKSYVNIFHIFFLLFFTGHFLTTFIIGIRINPGFGNILVNKSDLAILLVSSRTFFTLFILTTLFNPKIVFEKYFDVKKNKIVKQAKVDREFKIVSETGKYDLKDIDVVFSEYLLNKPYLKPGFSLTIISDDLKIPVHQISYYIKNRFGHTFNEWKNELRVQHAVDLIKDGKADYLTLESISIQCGYLSRANFVDAFKNIMDMPPSEYLTNFKNKQS